MKQYDYLIVGAGLFGAVFAHEAKKAGKKCLVIDKRDHIAGNIYTENVGEFSVDEIGAIARIFAKHHDASATWKDAQEYINVIEEEHAKLRVEDVAAVPTQSIEAYLAELKAKKK